MTAKGLRVPDAKPSGPLAQRDELVRKKAAAYDEYAAQTQQRQRAEHERGVAGRKLAAVESARATGAATDRTVEKLREEVNAADGAYEEALARANVALDTTKAIEVTLRQLYGDYFVDFATEAEQVSARADAAVDALVDAYRRAQQAWTEAQAVWQPLCQSVRIEGMEAFPLNDHIMAPVVQGWTARPASIEVLDLEPELNEDVEEAALLEGLNVAG